MKNKINFEILNGFINMIIIDVAQKYLIKIKETNVKPPKLIENYLDEAIFLLKEYKPIEISQIKNNVHYMSEDEQEEFKRLFKEDKEYEDLCKELNFAYLLTIDKEIQKKTITLLYNNIYEIKLLWADEKISSKKQINIAGVIEKSNKNKINKLHYLLNENNINNNYMAM